ncbi:hypothetical protein LDENG_00068490 [Lucifuga dentata]|nr:hypothetical protein LDENG_00068490 [Lucifuga dentata]
MEKIKQEAEQAKLEFQKHKLDLNKAGRISVEGLSDDFSGAGGVGDQFDVLTELRLVPKFNERDPETFFLLFKRLTGARGWPDATCTLMLQCVLSGRAQEVYSSLSWRRGDKTHLEFARDLSTHFDHWCMASGVESYEALRDLIILEQFKNSVPECIAIYISEQKVKTAAEAAALVDDYVLTHDSDNRHFCTQDVFAGKGSPTTFVRQAGFEQSSDRIVCESNKVCSYCHKRGHWKSDCYALKSKNQQTGSDTNVKPAMSVAPVMEQVSVPGPSVCNSDLKSYLLFITEGFVSLVGSHQKVLVKILRDTGAFDSFIVASVLPFSEDTYTGSFIPVLGMALNVIQVPLHKIMLYSDLFQGELSVGVRPALPMDGITLILGNNAAGDSLGRCSITCCCSRTSG